MVFILLELVIWSVFITGTPADKVKEISYSEIMANDKK
jgi:hypothetical protein